MKSDLLNIAFIILIAALGFFVLRGDIRHRKIRNKSVLAGFFGGMALFLVGFLSGAVEGWYLREVLVNSAIALVVGYVFWQFSLWPAGDAKLFVLFSFLLPLHFYWKSYLPFFPSMTLLANIFVCAYAFLLARSLLHLCVIIRRGYFFPGLVTETKAFFRKMNVFTVIGGLAKMLAVFALMRHFFAPGQGTDSGAARAFLVGTSVWISVIYIVRRYITDNESYAVSVDSVRSGMSPLISAKNSEIFSKEFLKELGPVRAEGLDGEQAELVRERLRSERVDFLDMQRHAPFSPWILVGLSVTMFLSDGILQFFRTMFR